MGARTHIRFAAFHEFFASAHLLDAVIQTVFAGAGESGARFHPEDGSDQIGDARSHLEDGTFQIADASVHSGYAPVQIIRASTHQKGAAFHLFRGRAHRAGRASILSPHSAQADCGK
jgi:hypothetical protein